MKNDTKNVLDQLTKSLEIEGFTKKKRGCLVRGAKNRIVQTVTLQPREYPNGMVSVQVYCQATWVEIEKLCATGWGRGFKLGDWFTSSHLLDGRGPYLFEQGIDASEMIELIVEDFIKFHKGTFGVMSSEKQLQDSNLSEIAHGRGYIERALAIEYILGGREAAEDLSDHLAEPSTDYTTFLMNMMNP